LGRSKVAVVVLALALAGSAVLHFTAWRKRERESARTATLYQQARHWQQEAKGCRGEVERLTTRLGGMHPLGPSAFDLALLKDQGLEDPVADLIADLQQHPELIPHPGVLGGVMRWTSADEIRVLSRRWIYAVFDDGHIGGESLLQYDLRAEGQISWKVLESQLD
jgi:hypothetical protein